MKLYFEFICYGSYLWQWEGVKTSFVQHPGSETSDFTQGFWSSLWKWRGCLGSESSQHEQRKAGTCAQIGIQHSEGSDDVCSLPSHKLLPLHQSSRHRVRPRMWKRFCKLQKSQENLLNPSTGFRRPWKNSVSHLDESQRHPGNCDYPQTNHVFCTPTGFPQGFCRLHHSSIYKTKG